jgi:pseudouridine synthase
MSDQQRLQRVLADAGVAARRACEEMIEEGRVSVNGEVVRRLPVFVDQENDRILVDGRPIPKPERLVYLMVHKPERCLVTTADEPGMGRRTVLDLVDHPAAPRLFPVGRLDYDTIGLVLLTNDGELANRLSHPRFAVPKTYHATVKGEVTPELLGYVQRRAKDVAKQRAVEDRSEWRERMGPGPLPGVRKRDLSPLNARVVEARDGKTTLEVTLVESRQRPIKEILLSIGLPLKRLARVAIGPLTLKHLALGGWRELTRDEVRLIKGTVKGVAAGRPARAATGVRVRRAGPKRPEKPKHSGKPGQRRSTRDRRA